MSRRIGSMMSESTTFDLAVLVLRVAFGLMLACHGYNKVFGAGGLAGTTRWFESLGLQPGWLHARIAAATELAAGTALTLGVLTALTCAAFIGLMTVAALTDHLGKGFFVFKGGWEYVGLVGIVAAVIAAIGPGEWSLDAVLDLHLHGWVWALAAIVLGVVAALGLLLTSRRPNVTPARRSATEGTNS